MVSVTSTLVLFGLDSFCKEGIFSNFEVLFWPFSVVYKNGLYKKKLAKFNFANLGYICFCDSSLYFLSKGFKKKLVRFMEIVIIRYTNDNQKGK